MGALTNSGTKLAFFAGLFKAMQASGAAIVFRLDALELSYMNMFATTWGLLGGSLLVAFPVIWYKVQNHSEEQEDYDTGTQKNNQTATGHRAENF